MWWSGRVSRFDRVRVMPLIVMLELPVFLSVVARAVLAVFTACTPNAKEVGDGLAVGPVPVPVKVTR